MSGDVYLSHSFVFKHEERAVCRTCNILLNVKHILLLFFCSETDNHRRPLILYCGRRNIPSDCSTLLGDEHPDIRSDGETVLHTGRCRLQATTSSFPHRVVATWKSLPSSVRRCSAVSLKKEALSCLAVWSIYLRLG